MDDTLFEDSMESLSKEEQDCQNHLKILENLASNLAKYQHVQPMLDVLGEIFGDIVLELCFEVHRKNKIESLFCTSQDGKNAEIQDIPGCDIFGQKPPKTCNESFICVHCSRPVSAARYAPHLEKCMGMGRNSSRIANRRMANIKRNSSSKITFTKQLSNSCTYSNDSSGEEAADDVDENADSPWVDKSLNSCGGSASRKNRRFKSKTTPDKPPSSPTRCPISIPFQRTLSNSASYTSKDSLDSHSLNRMSAVHSSNSPKIAIPDSASGNSLSTTPNHQPATADLAAPFGRSLSCEEIAKYKRLFAIQCSVISGITGKMCAKTLRCPQHSDCQRKSVREHFFGLHSPEEASAQDKGALPKKTSSFLKESSPNEFVDIDGDVDDENQAKSLEASSRSSSPCSESLLEACKEIRENSASNVNSAKRSRKPIRVRKKLRVR